MFTLATGHLNMSCHGVEKVYRASTRQDSLGIEVRTNSIALHSTALHSTAQYSTTRHHTASNKQAKFMIDIKTIVDI